MSKLILMPQQQFREWFKTHFPVTEWKLNKLFKEFEYDGENYIIKRLENEKTDGARPN